MSLATLRRVSRPPVSVIVPFHGALPEGAGTLAGFGWLELRSDDELLFVDNTRDQVLATLDPPPGGTVVHAPREQSSYHARNVGAERARNEWLLFSDADCRPARDLLDAYFSRPIDSRCALLPGKVAAEEEQGALIARYARSRFWPDQRYHVDHPFRPSGATGNLLVRRAAWDQVGGFLEGVRSGADVEFCWRVQDAGWTLDYREEAVVRYLHRERLTALARQAARYSAGNAWVGRRFPGSLERPKLLGPLTRCVAGMAVWILTARPRRALYKAIDAVWTVAEYGGYLGSNRAASKRTSPQARDTRRVVLFTDIFPALSESFIAGEARALQRLGVPLRVEASMRAPRPDRAAARELQATYLEDDSITAKFLAFAWLCARHPVRCIRDRLAVRRWAREEEVWTLRSLAPPARRLAVGGERHLHVHFAAAAALNALRLSRLTGISYSVTAHAYDIFKSPANLREKLERAAFTTTGCRYNVDYLRRLVGPGTAGRIHEVVMGVDGQRFRRRAPYPGGSTVVAIGRLVEKKGFFDLVEAVGLLRESRPIERLVIAGEGPLRGALEAQVARLGLEDCVELSGWAEPEAVRELLEQANLLAMPCVVAVDGDRDSMPVVVKEALAMEVPVVATREVGLPQVVRDEWGRLVPPGDPRALAAAIAELLGLPPEVRAAMGRRGREWVLEAFGLERQTARLARLLEEHSGQAPITPCSRARPRAGRTSSQSI